MANGDEPEAWYVRARGRILGPLTRAQLQSLRERGQLARFDQVSQDRQNWIGADRVDRLFRPSSAAGSPGSGATSSERVDFLILDQDDAGISPGKAGDSPEWYFARDGAHQGPIPLSELQRLADTKEIDGETLVWRSGMEQWTPGSWVSELSFTPRTGPSTPPTGGPFPDRVILATRTSVLAISSLVMGLLWMFGLGSVSAIVLGAISIRRIARSQGTLTVRRLAIAGMIIGLAGVIISAIVYRKFL